MDETEKRRAVRERLERLVLDALLLRLVPDNYGRDPVSDLSSFLDRATERLVASLRVEAGTVSDPEWTRMYAIAKAVPLFAVLPTTEYKAVEHALFVEPLRK